MVRKFLSLGILTAAGLVLVACDNPASGLLSTAKTGDCFSVTGKDAYGQPKLIKTDCPVGQASGSTLPPAAPDQTASTDAKQAADASKTEAAATAPASTTAAVCQPAAPVCTVAARHAVRTSRYGHATRYTHAGRIKRTHRVTHRRHGKVVTEVVTEYVDASGNEYTTAGPYQPAPPTTDTYVLGDHPVHAPPPPVRDRREYDHREYDHRSDEGRGSDSREYDHRSSQSYGASHSYESHSYSSSHSAPPPRHPCNCSRDHEPRYAPDGYLTWPNKSPY
jgi:hypothetical protein